MSNIQILKDNGELANFERAKLIASLSKSGASDSVVEKIVTEIEFLLFNGITTKEIYKKAFEKLKNHARPTAARYNLKKGILEFGPTGFPFEIFVGELLKQQGYSVKIGVITQGFCVQHELDVVAEKDNNHFMIECKFHSSFNTKCSVKIPLYIQSRFLDIEKQWVKQEGHGHKFHQGWVVNNTRFSEDAIQYAECMGLKLLGWDYPKNGSLKDIISTSGLYPITCLNTLKKSEKQALLNKNIVLCKQLCIETSLLDEIQIPALKQNKILKEARALCGFKL
ncbi:ATPase [Lutibacter sp. HS1-25]|uniref:ATP cone domain-containing protein n=1 Tax=Lutibacter sp. HS1-25 TaxID=2485000 RepID=UPI0010139ABE|nr:ATP cone domain-containing protein [Lutibacter sp. HS1-25]RXP54811.1 ATPase [Lutibacter sp. HS1-25]